MGDTAWYRKCTRCVHGNKPLDQSNRTCPRCVIGDRDNFKDRGEEWPLKDYVMQSLTDSSPKSAGVKNAGKPKNRKTPSRKRARRGQIKS